MKKFIALLTVLCIACALTAVCAETAETAAGIAPVEAEELIGLWMPDPDWLDGYVREMLGGEVDEAILEQYIELMSGTTVEFREDGTFVSTAWTGLSDTRSWRVEEGILYIDDEATDLLLEEGRLTICFSGEETVFVRAEAE